jgi:chemotaxis protein CheX
MPLLQESTTASAANTTLVVNPLLQATIEAFSTMLDCTVKRKSLAIKTSDTPFYGITAVIALTGKIVGTVCLSFPTATALTAVKRILDMDEDHVSPIVCDCVGEFANVIAGGAKNRLSEYDLDLGIPNIIRGESHLIEFARNSQPMAVTFDSDIGPFMLAFGFVQKS